MGTTTGKTESRQPPSAGARAAIRLKDFLPYQLSLLASHLALTNNELQWGEHKLSIQEWKVMAIVADAGPVTPVDIRRHGTQDKSTISWAIKRLQKQGLLLKRATPADGRTFEVLLSEAGWAYYDAIGKKARKRAREILGELGSEELRQFQRLVAKLLPIGDRRSDT